MYSFNDFIMFSIGLSFAIAGFFAFPYEPAHADVVRFEAVAAAAILVLWNIAYVHLYSPSIDDLGESSKLLLERLNLSFTDDGQLADPKGPVDASPEIVNFLKTLVRMNS